MIIRVPRSSGKLYCKPESNHEHKLIQKALRYRKWDRNCDSYLTKATLSSLLDVKAYIPQFKVADEATQKWIRTTILTAKRCQELQKGISETDRPVSLPQTIDYVWEPLPHQKEAIAYALNVPKCALWLDMGLGKTYTSITVAKLRQASSDLLFFRVLVVSPRSLFYQWESTISTLAPDAHIEVIKGTPGRKFKHVQKFENAGSRLRFMIISYESLAHMTDTLSRCYFDMFILDEATKMKNPKAQRTVATAELCNSIEYGISLTGMSFVNSPLDIFSQYLALDRTIFGENQWVFSDHYFIYGKAAFGKFIKGYKNMDELKDRSYRIAFSRTKNMCSGLPPKVYEVRKMPLYEAQYMWYTNILDQVENKAVEEDSPVTVEYLIAAMEKLQQITSGYIKADNGEYIWLDSPKYEELHHILSNSTDRFIVWARHTYVINKLVQYLSSKKYSLEVLDRRATDAKREMVKRKFKAGEIKVLVLQIQSECRGNDFTCQTCPVSAVFFENTPSIEERSQAEDRQHRLGMTGTAVYVDLLCEDTYDEGIQMLLSQKKTVSEFIREKSLDILLGKGGSIATKKTKSKKRPKSPDEVQAEIRKEEEILNACTHMEGMETF